MKEKQIRGLIENYQKHKEQLDKLNDKLNNLLGYDTNVTASYGFNTHGGKGTVSSKVERHIIKILETEDKIIEFEEKLYIVDYAEKVLNSKEKEVIELIKSGKYDKLTQIAKVLGQNKKYIYDTRDRAVKKMADYMSNTYENQF